MQATLLLIIPALIASPPAKIKKSPQTLCKELLGFNIAKLNPTESLEMSMLEQGKNWQRIKIRMVEIASDREEFWMKRIDSPDPATKVEARNTVIKFYRSYLFFSMWQPTWTDEDIDNAKGRVVVEGEKRYKEISEIR
jgi:hypothetical protein